MYRSTDTASHGTRFHGFLRFAAGLSAWALLYCAAATGARAQTDLVANSLSISATSVPPTGSVALSFEVDNAGDTDASAASTLEVWASTDQTFDRSGSDYLLGQATVNALQVGDQQFFNDQNNSSIVISPSAVGQLGNQTLPPGTYYIAVLLDVNQDVSGEVTTNNTVILGQQLTVAQGTPNLTADQLALSVNPVPFTGASDFSFRVRNEGTGSATTPTLAQIWASPDSDITGGGNDILLGQRTVDPIGAGGSESFDAGHSSQLTINPQTDGLTTGTYYVAVLLDVNHQLTNESDTSNTFVLAGTMTVVSTPPAQPDLIAQYIGPSNPSVSQLGPNSETRGTDIDVTMEVKNNGAGSAIATTAQIYLKTDNDFSDLSSAVLMATVPVGALAGGAAQDFDTPHANLVRIDPNAAGAGHDQVLDPGNYFLAVVVDANHDLSNESDTANTFLMNGQITVQPPVDFTEDGPDLIAESLVLDSTSISFNGSTALSFDIANIGNSASFDNSVEVWASPDPDFTFSGNDVLLTPTALPLPGQQNGEVIFFTSRSGSAVTIQGSALTSGKYFIAVRLDPTQENHELNSANTFLYGGVLTVGPPAPDLVADRIAMGQTTLHQDHTTHMTFRALNSGIADAPTATLAQVWASTDTAFDRGPTEFLLGQVPVSALAAGASQTFQQFDLSWLTINPATVVQNGTTTTLPAGDYNVAVLLDVNHDLPLEGNTANTFIMPGKLSIEAPIDSGLTGPDLVADNLALTSTTVVRGVGTVNLSLDVRNSGNAEADATTMQIFLSPDSIFTGNGNDIALNSNGFLVDQIEAGATESFSAENAIRIDPNAVSDGQGGTTSLAPGTYFIAAMLDVNEDLSEELDTANTFLYVGTLTVAGPPSRPNLAATQLALSSTNVTLDGTTLMSFQVSNTGNATAPASLAQIWASPDGTVDGTGNDVLLAQVPIAALSAGQSKVFQTSDQTAIPITPASVGPNGQQTLPPGIYTVAVILDVNHDIPNNANPIRTFLYNGSLTVLSPADLAANNLTINSATIPQFGSGFLSFQVKNLGQSLASGSQLAVYASPDSTITGSGNDILITQHTVGSLASSATQSFDLASLTALEINPGSVGPNGTDTLAPGTYFIGVILDINSQIPHEVRSNDTSVLAQQVTVTAAPSAPDLVADDLGFSSSTVPIDGSVTFSFRVRNIGGQGAPATTAEVWVSPDPTFTRGGNDVLIKQVSVAAIASGGVINFDTISQQQITITPAAAGPNGATALAQGTYYVAVILDVNHAISNEADTANTFTAPAQLTVSPPIPRDIIAERVSVPAAPVPIAGSFYVSWDARNAGAYPIGEISLAQIFASPDPTITGSGNDILIASQFVGTIDIGQSDVFDEAKGTGDFVKPTAVGPNGTSVLPAGTYYIGVIVDVNHNISHEITTNNISLSTQTLTIVEPQPGVPSGPIPTNKSTKVSVLRTLDWSDSPNTVNYDVYLTPALLAPLTITPKTITSNYQSPEKVAIGDVDGDGNSDVIAASLENNDVSVFSNTLGNGALWTTTSLTVQQPSAIAALTFFTTSTQQNLFVASLSGGLNYYLVDNTISPPSYLPPVPVPFKRLETTGRTTRTVTLTAPLRIRSIAGADLDKDGVTDVVTGADGGSELVVLMAHSTPPPAVPTPDPSVTPDPEATPTPAPTPQPSVAYDAFSVPTNFPVYDIKMVDVDQNGYPDIVCASLFGNAVMVFYNLGPVANPGAGVLPVNLVEVDVDTNINAPSSVAAADVNADGHADIFAASELDGQIVRYLNDPTTPTIFTRSTFLNNFGDASAVLTCDLNNDGFPDVVCASALLDKIVAFKNRPANPGVFDQVTLSTTSDRVLGLASGDLNANSDDDIAAVSQFGNLIQWFDTEPDISGASFRVAQGLTQSAFNPGQLQYSTPYIWQVVAHSVTLSAKGPIWSFKTQPARVVPTVSVDPNTIEQGAITLLNLSLQNVGPVALNGSLPNGSWQADVYASVNDTFSIANPGLAQLLNSYSLQNINSGQTQVVAPVPIPTTAVGAQHNVSLPEGVYHLFTVIDTGQLFTNHTWGDDVFKSPNLLVIAKKPDTPAGPTPPNGATGVNINTPLGWGAVNHATSYTVLLTEPTIVSSAQHFQESVISSSATDAISVATADLNGDGVVDLVALEGGANGQLLWYRNNGAHPPVFTPITIATGLNAPVWVSTGDVNGDGATDILVADSGDGTALWFESSGGASPTFTQHTLATGLGGLTQLVAGDLNLDGHMDAVSTSFFGPGLAWHEFFWNTASPHFVTHSIDSTTGKASAVTLADVNGDGLPDIVAAFWDAGPIVWYENNHNQPGQFIRHLIGNAGHQISALAAGDFNHDGHIDIVACSRQDNLVTWLESSGGANPTFTSHVLTSSAFGADAVSAADVDLDGYADIVVGSAFDDTVTFFHNNGTSPAGFTPTTITTAADFVRSVFVSDLDNAGSQELITASSNDNKLRFFSLTQTVSLGNSHVQAFSVPAQSSPPSFVQPAPPLLAGFTYTWQVIAGNFSYRVAGPLWSFTTGRPELTAINTAISPSSIPLNGAFTVTFTDKNTGDGQALAHVDRVYASLDPLISGATNDLLLGEVSVGALDPGASSTFTINVDAGAVGAGGLGKLSLGNYYIGVLIDADNQEPSESNELNSFIIQPRLTVGSGNATGDDWLRYR